jgi:hypothetical protein
LKKNIISFFQNGVINKNSENVPLFISIFGSAIVYVVIAILIQWYLIIIFGENNSCFEDFISNMLYADQTIAIKMFIEVFIGSILFLGGRSLIYGKLVLGLNNAELKVLSYD